MGYVPKIERDKVSEDSCATCFLFGGMKEREKGKEKRKGRRLLNEKKREWGEKERERRLLPSLIHPLSFSIRLFVDPTIIHNGMGTYAECVRGVGAEKGRWGGLFMRWR